MRVEELVLDGLNVGPEWQRPREDLVLNTLVVAVEQETAKPCRDKVRYSQTAYPTKFNTKISVNKV